MDDAQSDSINPARLPELIELIIKADKEVCLSTMQLISRSWNNEVKAYRKQLPPIHRLTFHVDREKPANIYVEFVVEKEESEHFEGIFPVGNTPRIVKTQSWCTIDFILPLNHPLLDRFLLRLFNATKRIDLLHIDRLDRLTLLLVRRHMRFVPIEEMIVSGTEFFCKLSTVLAELICHLRVNSFILEQDRIDDSADMCQFLSTIAATTSCVFIRLDDEFILAPREKSYWNYVAPIVAKQTNLLILSKDRLVVDQRPFLDFLRLFDDF